MPITFNCQTCGGVAKAPDAAAGRKAKCGKCGAMLTVPGGDTVAANTPELKPAVVTAPTPPPAVQSAAIARVVAAGPLVAYPSSGGEVEPRGGDSREDDKYTECPFCGEEVLAKAKKCKHCLETLDVALRAAEEAKRESRRGRQGAVNVRQETYVDVHRPPFNHGLHIVLDVLTCGAWLPIHILCWMLH